MKSLIQTITVLMALMLVTTAIAQDNQEKSEAGFNKMTALEKKLADLQGQLDAAYKEIAQWQKEVGELRIREEEKLQEIRAMTADIICIREQMKDISRFIAGIERVADNDHAQLTRLAAECSERGDFKKAIEYQEKAIEVARAEKRYGIGVAIEKSGGLIRISHVLPNMPAHGSGLMPGDRIEAVDGVNTKDMSQYEAAAAITGQKGTKVKLTVRHSGKTSTEDITITRQMPVSIVPSEYEWRLAAYKAGKTWPEYRITIGQPRKQKEEVTQVFNLKYIDCEEAAQMLANLLQADNQKVKYEKWESKDTARTIQPLTIVPDKRTNQLLVYGTQQDIERVKELIAELDVPARKKAPETGQPEKRQKEIVDIAVSEPSQIPTRQLEKPTPRPGYSIPQTNLQIPDKLKPCAERLRKIYTALKKYEKEKDRMPDWLSALVPSYLEAETLFCPDDKSHKSSYWPDPDLPCSYCYELNPTELGGRPPLDKTMRHYKTLQYGLFGGVLPIVRCFHHGRVLNLAWDGRIYTSPLWFEQLFIPNYSRRMLYEVSPEKPDAPPARTETLAMPESKVLAFDDFEGKLGLKWDIINPNLSNFSLTSKPGTLTITTKKGHFSRDNKNYENVFLIETPVTNDKDFQITTCISSFEPRACWNQAGIVCWDDEDNYVKLVYEWAGAIAFTVGHEVGGRDSYTYKKAPPDIEKIWLRITKRGSSYECSTSTDGKSYTVQNSVTWKKDLPKQVGLFANNGSFWPEPVQDLDASFDFFEVAAVATKWIEVAVATKPTGIAVATKPTTGVVIATKPTSVFVATKQNGAVVIAETTAASTGSQKPTIPQANLEIPEEMKSCAKNLEKIHSALENYKKAKDVYPDFLSDLVPEYLSKDALICPVHPNSTPPYAPDPKLACSYEYQYGNQPYGRDKQMTYREFMDAELKYFGTMVPIVRCYAHSEHLNLAFDGRIYTSELSWERTVMQAEPKQEHRSDVDYETDMEAFIEEIDLTYPFFELKGIREDWSDTCKRIREEVKGCQSDQVFLRLVMEAFRCLRDGHMGFRHVNAEMPPLPRRYFPDISFMPATDGRVVLMTDRTDLDPDLKTGTVVTKIDGEDARNLLEGRAEAAWAEGGGFSSPQRASLYEFRIPLRDEEKGKKHTITISVDSKERDVELVSETEARGWPHWYNRPKNLNQVGGSCWYGKLPSGVGYIYLRRIDSSAGRGMKEAFTTHADAKGWIIDLRGNGGGGYGNELYEALRTLPRPLAGIIDAGCFSAGETLARDLVQYGNARLFGSPTAGSSSAKRTWSFPSGIASLLLSRRSRWGIGGQPIEFNGIRPDEHVEAVPEEVQRGLNSAILRAEEYLTKMAAADTQ